MADPTTRPHRHGNGAACVTYFVEHEVTYVVTAGNDGRVAIRSLNGDVLRETDEINREGPIYCIAVSPDGAFVATGNDTGVQLYKTSEGMDFIQIAAANQFAVRALAFSPEGDLLAAAGDDDKVSIITLDLDGDSVVSHSLDAGPNTRGLAWDPAGTYLAVAQTNGHVQLWDASIAEEVWKDRCAPAVDIDSPAGIGVAWHPSEGKALAMPIKDTPGDVAICERLLWGRKSICRVTGVHTDTVTRMFFSPNGRYLATASQDKHLVVSDVTSAQPKTVVKHKLDALVTGGCWCPSANALTVILANDSIVSCCSIIPSHLVEPHDMAACVRDVRDTNAPGGTMPELDTQLENDLAHLGVAPAPMDPIDPMVDAPDSPNEHPSGYPSVAPALVNLPRPQPAFQSGAGPRDTSAADDQFLLQYNLVGRVLQRSLGDVHVVDVAYHNLAKHRKKMPPIRSTHEYTLAALAESGLLLASPLSTTANATVAFEPYEALSSKASWQRTLDTTEEPVCVAAGAHFAAVATDRNAVHVWSTSGFLRASLSIGGAIVTLAAAGPLLAIAWHRAAPSPAGQQCVQLTVHNIATQRCVADTPLALSPGSTLTWLCFSDALAPVALDSRRVLRLWTPAFGGAWSVVLDANKDLERVSDGMKDMTDPVPWPIGIVASTFVFFGIEAGTAPSVRPLPEVLEQELPGPAVPTEVALEEHEGALTVLRLRLSAAVHAMTIAAESPDLVDKSGDWDGAAEQLRVQVDKLLLRMFDAALKADQLDRCMQLISECANEKTMALAVRIANHKRKGVIAERIQGLIDARFHADPEEEGREDDMFGTAPQVERSRAAREAVTGRSEDAPPVNAPPAAFTALPASAGQGTLSHASDKPQARKRPAALSKNPFSRSNKSARH